MNVCYLILTYNNVTDTIETIESIKLQQHANIDIFVVDNNSKEIYKNKLKYYLEENNIKYQFREVNDGYAGGNNFGFKLLKDKYDVIIIVNNDILIFGSEITKNIVDLFRDYNDIAVITPKVLYGDNKEIMDSFVHKLFFYRKGYYKFKKNKLFNERPSSIGCFLAIRTKAIEDGNVFDSSFFMYAEELDFGFRIWNNGYKFVRLNSDNNDYVYHKGGNSPFSSSGTWKYYLSIRNAILCTFNIYKFNDKFFYIFLNFLVLLKMVFWGRYGIKNKLAMLSGFSKGLYIFAVNPSKEYIFEDAMKKIKKYNVSVYRVGKPRL